MIEKNIFQRYLPDYEKLKEYGFNQDNNGLKLEKIFKDDLFKAIIKINKEGIVTGIVYDLENNDEFLPLRIENTQGAFASEVRNEYEKLLTNIRDNCFLKQYYIYPQSNRITNLVLEKYGDEPEFLWDKFKGSGVFRNPKTKKWYLAILDTDRSKIQENKKGLIEVGLIKLSVENIEKLLKQKHFYPAWHMNKKHWITVILDDSLPDDRIMELIEESHGFSCVK